MSAVNNGMISISVFQGKIKDDANANLEKTIEQLTIAESRGIDILCMPESFLHGYYESKKDALSIVVQSGPYKGDMIVNQHRYCFKGNIPLSSYDWDWLFTPRGKQIKLYKQED